jgi:hypothetical protein
MCTTYMHVCSLFDYVHPKLEGIQQVKNLLVLFGSHRILQTHPTLSLFGGKKF